MFSLFFKSGSRERGQVRAYLDYAAQTPLGAAASRALSSYAKEGLTAVFGNPASTHLEGLTASRTLEAARKTVAGLLEVQRDEVVFTGNATESNNLAILGTVRKAELSRGRGKGVAPLHIITSVIEHSSILAVCKELEREGVEVTYLTPTKEGVISARDVEKALRSETVLVTLSYVNSELGTITNVRDIGRSITSFKKKKDEKERAYPYFHVDGSQAVTQLPLNPHALGADMLTIDSGKCYGPKGVAVLVVLRERDILPIMWGGGHEKGLRPGTPSPMLVEAFAAAFEEMMLFSKEERARLQALEVYFLEKLKEDVPKAVFMVEESSRLVGFCNICIEGLSAEYAVIQLDVRGVAVSAASACISIGGTGSSYVVAALPGGENCASSSLRISMGRYTTEEDIDHFLRALKEILALTEGTSQ